MKISFAESFVELYKVQWDLKTVLCLVERNSPPKGNVTIVTSKDYLSLSTIFIYYPKI